MKLLYCKKCGSVFNLSMKEKTCDCRETKGKYNDILNAEYSGKNAVPLGFDNKSFSIALLKRPVKGLGKTFTSFIIPEENETFSKKD